MGLIMGLKHKLYVKMKNHLSRATLVEGILRNTSMPLRCLFIENSDVQSYLTPRMYTDKPRILKEWRVWLPSLKNTIESPDNSFDLCVAVLPRTLQPEFKGAYVFSGDEYVRQIIDLSGSLEDVKKRFNQTKRQISNKLVSKFGLTYRISKDLKDFDHFYHQMFVPLIRKKYGELASIESFDEMKRYFLQGFLLLVLSGEQVVAGNLCYIKDDTLIFRRSGLLNGDEAYLKLHAQDAIYFFSILHAKDLGLRMFDTMKSRSLMQDGVYRTKREWGATVYPDDEAESRVHYIIRKPSEPVAHFLEANPIIIHSPGNIPNVLSTLAGWSQLQAPSLQEKRELSRKYDVPGLTSLQLFTSDTIINMSIPVTDTSSPEAVTNDLAGSVFN